MSYDTWLEAPYQDRCEANEAFHDWCETHNIDPDDKDAETLYQDYIDSSFEEPDFDYEGDEEDDYR